MAQSIMDQISSDIKVSMKARDKFRTQVLRMVLSEFKYALTAETKQSGLNDDQSTAILASYHKRLTKSLDEYPDGEKKDEIVKEIEVVAEYLPKKVDENTVKKAIEDLLSSTDERQFGVLMKSLMTKFGTAVDGKMLSTLLKGKLG